MSKNKKQNYILGIIGVVALLFIGYMLGQGGGDKTPKAEGKLEILETDYDFGVIGLDNVTHEFPIKNIGEGPLKISRVATSCGCTTAQLQKGGETSVKFGMDHGNLPKPNMTLEPGEEAVVLVTYNPLTHGLKNAAGTFRRIVYIQTDNPRSEYELSISMKVDPNKKIVQNPKIEVNQSSYDFGKINRKDGIVETTFTITNSGSEELVIEDMSTSCGCTTAELSSKTLKSGESADLLVKFDPDFHKEPQGRLERTVTLFTNDPDNSEFNVDIYAEIIE